MDDAIASSPGDVLSVIAPWRSFLNASRLRFGPQKPTRLSTTSF
jgi:hypothetical protein